MGLGFFYGNQQRWGETLQLFVANFVEGHDPNGFSVGSLWFCARRPAKDLERCHWMDSTRVLGPLFLGPA